MCGDDAGSFADLLHDRSDDMSSNSIKFEEFKREVFIMSCLRHSCLVQVCALFLFSLFHFLSLSLSPHHWLQLYGVTVNPPQMVMEFMPKGNLCDLLHSGADVPYTFILKALFSLSGLTIDLCLSGVQGRVAWHAIPAPLNDPAHSPPVRCFFCSFSFGKNSFFFPFLLDKGI